MKVFLIGRVALESPGVLTDERNLPGRQGRLLFAYLVVEQGRAVPRDELADALWGEKPPATWEKALTVLVSKLRTLLTEHGINATAALTSAFGCYQLDLPDGSWVDVVSATKSVERAETALAAGTPDLAVKEAGKAARQMEQTFLPGDEGPWVERRRRALADVRLRALATLAEASLRSGRVREAAQWAEQCIALEPFREAGYRSLMEAHAAAGNRAEGLRVYDRCRQLLSDELGAYPSPETESIYRTLLEDPALPVQTAAPVTVAPVPELGVRTPPQFLVPSRRRHRPRALIAGIAVLAVVAAVTAGTLIRSHGSRATTLVANSLGMLDAHGKVVADVGLDGTPTSVAVDKGAVWTTYASENTAVRIDPATNTVRQTVAVGADPSGIAVGNGGVWVANHDDSTVSWINAQSNTVVGKIRVGNGPSAIAVGFGSVWVTNAADRTVSRIDAATGRVVAVITAEAVGRGITVGGGSVWVTDESTSALVRIDPASNRVTMRGVIGGGPAGLAYGAGAVWVANNLDDTLAEVDPQTLHVRATVPVVGGPEDVVFTRGSVWVSAPYSGRLLKVDPTSLRSVAYPVDRPGGLAASQGGLWVAAQASGTGHRGGRLVVLGGIFDSIDPAMTGFGAGEELGSVYDELVTFRHTGGSAGSQLVPDLAAALPVPTASGRTYTWELRPDINYSDGTPLRAADFRRALERLFVVHSPVIDDFPVLRKVLGATHCGVSKRCDLSQGVVVAGSSVTFQLTEPDPSLLLALTALIPVPPGTPDKDPGTRPIASTGPYVIKSYDPKRGLTLARNIHFRVWSAAARPDGYPDEIVWRVNATGDKVVSEIMSGTADVTGIPENRVSELAARFPRQLHIVPQRGTRLIFLNNDRAPFNDIRARRAIAYAIDRRKLATIGGIDATDVPTCQAVPPTMPGYQPYCPFTVDPDQTGHWTGPDLTKARALIAASGTRGQHIDVWTGPMNAEQATYMVGLLDRLGYHARRRLVTEIPKYFKTLQTGVQMGFGGWFGLQLGADIFEPLRCGSPDNWARFCDRQLDRQVRQLAAEERGDPTAGAALASRIDREIVDRAPWIPVFTPGFVDFVSSRVGNYQVNTNLAATELVDQLWVR